MKFSHECSKLSKEIFTTIRKNTGYYRVRQTYQIITPKQHFNAWVYGSQVIKKADITNELAQADADMTAVELVALLEKWYGKDFDNFVLLTLMR